MVSDVDPPRWSEDGRHLYCLTRDGFREFAASGDSGRSVRLTVDRRVFGRAQRPATNTVWSAGHNQLMLMARNPRSKDMGLARVNTADGRTELLVELPKHAGWWQFQTDISERSSAIYLILESDNHPAELWRFNAGTRECARLFALNHHFDDVAHATSRLLQYRALDGETRQAAIFLPPGYSDGDSVPVIADVYGGANASDSLRLLKVWAE